MTINSHVKRIRPGIRNGTNVTVFETDLQLEDRHPQHDSAAVESVFHYVYGLLASGLIIGPVTVTGV